MRKYPASLQMGQLTASRSVEIAPVPVLIGIEMALMTSPMCRMTFAFLRAAPGNGPIFEDAVDITPIAPVVIDRFPDRVLDPFRWVGFERVDQAFGDQWRQ